MNNSIFNYNGNNITMKMENGNVYVNATEMAKSFNTRPIDWLRTEQSQRLINALTETHFCTSADLVQVTKGGDINNQGTWMHEDVALVFSQWLSPEFYILCNGKIKELLKNGYTKLDTISRKDLAKMLLESEEEKERMNLQIESQQKQLQQQIPAVVFRDSVSASDTVISVADLAKLICQNGIDTGEHRLYKWLVENNYLICRSRWSKTRNRCENDYMPYQRYAEMGLFFVNETVIQGNGEPFVKHTVKITGKGQIYFINKFLKNVS